LFADGGQSNRICRIYPIRAGQYLVAIAIADGIRGAPTMTTHASSNAAPATPVTLITGGSRGLGRSMALRLAEHGHDLAITYRQRADEAAAVVAAIEALGRRAVALPLDTADAGSFPTFAAAVRDALARMGHAHLYALVNNAGTGVHTPYAETGADDLDTLYAIHLKGPFLLAQALLPLLADGSRILNVSSGLARFTVPGYAAYAAMKGAVEVLSRYQAKELGARGIAVNTLAPGAIETDFGGGAVRDDAQLNAYLASQTALGRVGLPDDIGEAVAALLSPGCRWINGQRIEVSGGMFL
jgi:NAD(P)-dependent dehydrogenase (short-subunit alcohol dehydrogenase family)